MENQGILSDEAILSLLKEAYLFAKPDYPAGAEALRLDTTIEESGIESVAALEMTGFIEERLDIQFSDNEVGAVRGMQDLARLIRKHGGVKHRLAVGS